MPSTEVSVAIDAQQLPDLVEGIGLLDRLVLPPAGDARKAQRDAGLVPRGRLDTFEGDFQHLLGLERAHRAEFFHGIAPDPVIQLLDLLVGQPDRKSTRLNSSHVKISYAVFCLK